MTKKLFSLFGVSIMAGAASAKAATVAQMSGTVFTSQQFSQPNSTGLSEPLALAVFGGVVLLFTMLSRRRSA